MFWLSNSIGLPLPLRLESSQEWAGEPWKGPGKVRSGGGTTLFMLGQKMGEGEELGGLAIIVACFILTLPVTIFGGLGGAIGGAFPSSPEYVEAAESTLSESLAKYPIQEIFQSFFLKEARARTSHTFVVSPKEGSQSSEGMGGQGMDTVLEFSVQRIWWKRTDDREEQMNPPMVLALVVRIRLVRGTEKTVWYDQTFVHETESRLYTLWPYPIFFQMEIEKAYQHLAEQMVEKLFLSNPAT